MLNVRNLQHFWFIKKHIWAFRHCFSKIENSFAGIKEVMGCSAALNHKSCRKFAQKSCFKKTKCPAFSEWKTSAKSARNVNGHNCIKSSTLIQEIEWTSLNPLALHHNCSLVYVHLIKLFMSTVRHQNQGHSPNHFWWLWAHFSNAKEA